MNLKSKAISEIKATILTLSAHREFADRIEGLQVLLGELEAEQGGKGVPTEDEITAAMDVAYKKAGHNAYYGNGFRDGAQWAISLQPEWVSVKDRLPPPMQMVICFAHGEVHSRLFSRGWSELSLEEFTKRSPVTHWMPLPQPPIT